METDQFVTYFDTWFEETKNIKYAEDGSIAEIRYSYVQKFSDNYQPKR